MHERYIARQPIFDSHMKLYGYELLFRGEAKNTYTHSKNATTTLIVDATMLFDLRELTGSAKAFINLDRSALLNGAALLLPPNHTVIEILASVEPTPEIVAACHELCDKGYTLALDDFVEHAKWIALLSLVKFLKVDFGISQAEEREAIALRYHGKGLHLLATKIETQASMRDAERLGYSFFQGYFFCKPNMVEAREIPPNKIMYLRLLEALTASEMSHDAVETLIKQDPSLVYRLLRYLNSPLLGLRAEIHSIRDAINLLGEQGFRRWATILAVAAMATGKPPELIRTALTRAYFCEEIAEPLGMSGDSSDLFLMGLLSVTDALLDQPMHQVLARLPVSQDVCSALSHENSRFSDIYKLVLSYEHGDWDKVSSALDGRNEAAREHIPACYLSAARRANEIVATSA